MPYTCAQCGAVYPSGGTCQDRFNQCLALEYENPAAYGAVHLLTVACYRLQHNLYSRQGWLESRQLVAQTLRLGSNTDEIRKEYQRRLGSGQRNWSVTKGEKLKEFDLIHWSCTIAEIPLDSPARYVAAVRQWAACILEDTDWIAPGSIPQSGHG
jgi:hypothetical protein